MILQASACIDLNTAIPIFTHSEGFISIIDSGVGHYELVMSKQLQIDYIWTGTVRCKADYPIMITECEDIERTRSSFSVFLCDLHGNPMDACFDIMVWGLDYE